MTNDRKQIKSIRILNQRIIITSFDTIHHKIESLFPQKPTLFYLGKLFSTQIDP